MHRPARVKKKISLFVLVCLDGTLVGMEDQRQLVYEKLGVGNCRVLQEQYSLHLFPRESFVGTGLGLGLGLGSRGTDWAKSACFFRSPPILRHTQPALDVTRPPTAQFWI